jgi:hypothetical protein
LVAATTVMLLLARPKRLMLGYWLGAMLTSVTLGLVIVFTLEGSGFEQSAKKTVGPAIVLTLAGLVLLAVLVLATGRDKPFEERRRARKEGKKPPRWERWMQKGDPKITFVIGVLLSFPGALVPRGARLAGQDALLDVRDRAGRDRVLPGRAGAARRPNNRVLDLAGADPGRHRPR